MLCAVHKIIGGEIHCKVCGDLHAVYFIFTVSAEICIEDNVALVLNLTVKNVLALCTRIFCLVVSAARAALGAFGVITNAVTLGRPMIQVVNSVVGMAGLSLGYVGNGILVFGFLIGIIGNLGLFGYYGLIGLRLGGCRY